MKEFQVVWVEIRATVKQWNTQAQSLWLTGHRLGGAVATLRMASLGEEAKSVHGLYTFGQPRVGGNAFARNFDLDCKTRMFPFVNNHDVVTREPP